MDFSQDIDAMSQGRSAVGGADYAQQLFGGGGPQQRPGINGFLDALVEGVKDDFRAMPHAIDYLNGVAYSPDTDPEEKKQAWKGLMAIGAWFGTAALGGAGGALKGLAATKYLGPAATALKTAGVGAEFMPEAIEGLQATGNALSKTGSVLQAFDKPLLAGATMGAFQAAENPDQATWESFAGNVVGGAAVGGLLHAGAKGLGKGIEKALGKEVTTAGGGAAELAGGGLATGGAEAPASGFSENVRKQLRTEFYNRAKDAGLNKDNPAAMMGWTRKNLGKPSAHLSLLNDDDLVKAVNTVRGQVGRGPIGAEDIGRMRLRTFVEDGPAKGALVEFPDEESAHAFAMGRTAGVTNDDNWAYLYRQSLLKDLKKGGRRTAPTFAEFMEKGPDAIIDDLAEAAPTTKPMPVSPPGAEPNAQPPAANGSTAAPAAKPAKAPKAAPHSLNAERTQLTTRTGTVGVGDQVSMGNKIAGKVTAFEKDRYGNDLVKLDNGKRVLISRVYALGPDGNPVPAPPKGKTGPKPEKLAKKGKLLPEAARRAEDARREKAAVEHMTKWVDLNMPAGSPGSAKARAYLDAVPKAIAAFKKTGDVGEAMKAAEAELMSPLMRNWDALDANGWRVMKQQMESTDSGKAAVSEFIRAKTFLNELRERIPHLRWKPKEVIVAPQDAPSVVSRTRTITLPDGSTIHSVVQRTNSGTRATQIGSTRTVFDFTEANEVTSALAALKKRGGKAWGEWERNGGAPPRVQKSANAQLAKLDRMIPEAENTLDRGRESMNAKQIANHERKIATLKKWQAELQNVVRAAPEGRPAVAAEQRGADLMEDVIGTPPVRTSAENAQIAVRFKTKAGAESMILSRPNPGESEQAARARVQKSAMARGATDIEHGDWDGKTFRPLVEKEQKATAALSPNDRVTDALQTLSDNTSTKDEKDAAQGALRAIATWALQLEPAKRKQFMDQFEVEAGGGGNKMIVEQYMDMIRQEQGRLAPGAAIPRGGSTEDMF